MEASFSMSPGVFKYSSHLKPSFGAGAGAGYDGEGGAGGGMLGLDEEISHLQKETSHADSQLHRIKADVTSMETDAASEDKVRTAQCSLLKQR